MKWKNLPPDLFFSLFSAAFFLICCLTLASSELPSLLMGIVLYRVLKLLLLTRIQALNFVLFALAFLAWAFSFGMPLFFAVSFIAHAAFDWFQKGRPWPAFGKFEKFWLLEDPTLFPKLALTLTSVVPVLDAAVCFLFATEQRGVAYLIAWGFTLFLRPIFLGMKVMTSEVSNRSAYLRQAAVLCFVSLLAVLFSSEILTFLLGSRASEDSVQFISGILGWFCLSEVGFLLGESATYRMISVIDLKHLSKSALMKVFLPTFGFSVALYGFCIYSFGVDLVSMARVSCAGIFLSLLREFYRKCGGFNGEQSLSIRA